MGLEDQNQMPNGKMICQHCKKEFTDRNLFTEHRIACLEEVLHRETVYGLKGESNIPRRFKDMTKENWIGEFPLKNMDIEKGLMVCGNIGRGKTMLASIIGNYFIEKEERVYFINVVSILHLSKMNDEYIEKCRRAKLLILDDIGQGDITIKGQRIIFELVNWKYDKCLPVIFTTNYFPDELTEFIGEPIVSRIYQMCDRLNLEGPDRRMPEDANHD